ncbi:MAG: Rab family GTPase [Bacteroidota bacterium]
MDLTKQIKRKIALLGSHAVGKTSLISQFVEGKFPEKYLTTIGLKVDSKHLVIDDYALDLVVWDIAGQDDPTRIPHYYLNGCHGFIYVVDLSRASTYRNMKTNLHLLQGIIPKASRLIAGNKVDLLSSQELEEVKTQTPLPLDFLTSAKTGENVELLFQELGKKLIHTYETTGS